MAAPGRAVPCHAIVLPCGVSTQALLHGGRLSKAPSDVLLPLNFLQQWDQLSCVLQALDRAQH